MKKIEVALIIGIIASIFLSNFNVFAKECNEIRGSVLRLHILANSDISEDQELKLKVRDRILKDTNETFNSKSSLKDAKQTAEENMELVKSIAQDEVEKQGYDYQVDAKLVNMFFDTRTYDQITMPAGKYDAIRITIGSAKGHNWWCVAYPPICVPAAQPKKELSDVLTEQQVELVESKPKYEVRFAIVELFESIKNAIKK